MHAFSKNSWNYKKIYLKKTSGIDKKLCRKYQRTATPKKY